MASGRREPGVKGAKVKLMFNKKGEPRRWLPKKPLPELDAADLQEQSTIYLRQRNRTMKLKRTKAELELGVNRDRLIERELVLKQLAYLLVAMRQKL
jgi:hypothetical protein